MDNEDNRMIAAKVRQIDRSHVQRLNQISETNNHDITSPLEGMTLRNDQIHGGSGFASATVADLGLNQLMEQLILQRVAVYLVEREPVQKQNQVRGSQAEPY